ncbi:MAG: 2Fe-2S iron-sulfur cluster-binding protein, partial [Candidatus Syntrophosphaera sp.]|nr:2Fe-2S iron-sulfur cluster-binding protein [Candidatus Syntrophosphaera sp.]
LTAYALLKKNPHPTRQQVRQAIRGNLCRCTGYQQIIDAILLAAERLDLKQP